MYWLEGALIQQLLERVMEEIYQEQKSFPLKRRTARMMTTTIPAPHPPARRQADALRRIVRAQLSG